MGNIKSFLLAGIISLGIYSTAFADTFPNTNLNNDSIENLYDFAIFANSLMVFSSSVSQMFWLFDIVLFNGGVALFFIVLYSKQKN